MVTIRNIIARIGEIFIYFLIRVFGRKTDFNENPWLKGPLGKDIIGDKPYHEVAEAEGLELQRNSEVGGLIPDFNSLSGTGFTVEKVHPHIRAFYENTAAHRMDVWPKTYFPANMALWLLVTTISRKVNQLNFPTNALDMALGMSSEVILLKNKEQQVKYTGWFRKIEGNDRVLYNGFYMIARCPLSDRPSVKVVFPMPDGNATVFLRPENGENGAFILNSNGKGFGDVGFYRVQNQRGGMRVWLVSSLKEKFIVYVDKKNVLRCDHSIKFLGMPVLKLHYRIVRNNA
ncbi:hypothetical protein GC194_03260 [bacterium]|nr:hypothetical protein [bacterium]